MATLSTSGNSSFSERSCLTEGRSSKSSLSLHSPAQSASIHVQKDMLAQRPKPAWAGKGFFTLELVVREDNTGTYNLQAGPKAEACRNTQLSLLSQIIRDLLPHGGTTDSRLGTFISINNKKCPQTCPHTNMVVVSSPLRLTLSWLTPKTNQYMGTNAYVPTQMQKGYHGNFCVVCIKPHFKKNLQF